MHEEDEENCDVRIQNGPSSGYKKDETDCGNEVGANDGQEADEASLKIDIFPGFGDQLSREFENVYLGRKGNYFHHIRNVTYPINAIIITTTE